METGSQAGYADDEHRTTAHSFLLGRPSHGDVGILRKHQLAAELWRCARDLPDGLEPLYIPTKKSLRNSHVPPMLGFWPVLCPRWNKLSTLTTGGVHSAHFSGDFVQRNFESTSFWQISLNGLKLNNAAVTSRLAIAALLSLSRPSCPLKSTPSIAVPRP